MISALADETITTSDFLLFWDADGPTLKKVDAGELGVVFGGRDTGASDIRYKKNINPVTGALEKLSKLNPVNYDWREDEFKNKGFNDKKQWGFIAQEVEKVMPELVGSDEDDYLTLNYNGFVPLLTKAMQEQQT